MVVRNTPETSLAWISGDNQDEHRVRSGQADRELGNTHMIGRMVLASGAICGALMLIWALWMAPRDAGQTPADRTTSHHAEPAPGQRPAILSAQTRPPRGRPLVTRPDPAALRPVARPARFDSPAPAPSTEPAPRTYIVKAGDNLPSIALHLYGSAANDLRLLAANPDVLRDPSQLRVGMVLRIPDM